MLFKCQVACHFERTLWNKKKVLERPLSDQSVPVLRVDSQSLTKKAQVGRNNLL